MKQGSKIGFSHRVIGLLVQLLAMIGILYFFRDEHVLIPMIILLLMSYLKRLYPLLNQLHVIFQSDKVFKISGLYSHGR